jgi:CheY-like chemotaxis protein
MTLTDSQIAQNKAAAKQCMLKADQFIKELHFTEAKAEIHKAKSLDPSNMYISAFIDRINYFEEQKKADIAKKKESLEAENKKPDTGQTDIKSSDDKVAVKAEINPVQKRVLATPAPPIIPIVEKPATEKKPQVKPVQPPQQPKPASVQPAQPVVPKVEKTVPEVKPQVKPVQPPQQPKPVIPQSAQPVVPKIEKTVPEVKPQVKPVQPPQQPKPASVQPAQPVVPKVEKTVPEVKPQVKPVQPPQQPKPASVQPAQPVVPKVEKTVPEVKPQVKPVQPPQQPKPASVQPAQTVIPKVEKPVTEVKPQIKTIQPSQQSKPVAAQTAQAMIPKVEKEASTSVNIEQAPVHQKKSDTPPVVSASKKSEATIESKSGDISPKKSAEEQLFELIGQIQPQTKQPQPPSQHAVPAEDKVFPTTPIVPVLEPVQSKTPEVSAVPLDVHPQKPIEPARQHHGPMQFPEKVVSISSLNIHDTAAEKDITAHQLHEMKKQIERLSAALEQEKKAREEMHRNTVHDILPKFRTLLEDAWIDGAPSDAKKTELQQLARTMSIPDVLFFSMQREVKIEMYGRAAKEIIAKRQVVRHSSSTLEWLRKVYQISMEEYVEYESKFLLDLVAEQYKGVIFQISSDDRTKQDLMPKLKSNGFAVITSPNPEDALEKIEKLNPNAIVCESSFGPGSISGIKFLHILRTNSKYNFVPFIFLSAPDDIPLLTAAELKPNEGFIRKPVDFEDLSAMINTKFLWLKDYVMSLSQ